jgi:hypothetical protein
MHVKTITCKDQRTNNTSNFLKLGILLVSTSQGENPFNAGTYYLISEMEQNWVYTQCCSGNKSKDRHMEESNNFQIT